VESVETMLVWIGVVITAQGFTSTSRIAAGAIAMGMIPGICAWTVNFLQAVLSDGHQTIEELIVARPDLNLPGLLAVSSGYLYVSVVLASMYAHVEERRFSSAALWAFIGAGLSSIGMIHSFRIRGNDVMVDIGFLHTDQSRQFSTTYLLMGMLFSVTSLGMAEDSDGWTSLEICKSITLLSSRRGRSSIMDILGAKEPPLTPVSVPPSPADWSTTGSPPEVSPHTPLLAGSAADDIHLVAESRW
jgi:hypothetical protein